MMKPQKTQCIKHILEFYTGSGKGVAPTLNNAVLKFPIQLVQIQYGMDVLYQGTAIRVRSDQISFSFHKETKSLKGKINIVYVHVTL